MMYGRQEGSESSRIPLTVDKHGRLLTSPKIPMKPLGYIQLDLEGGAVPLDAPDGSLLAVVKPEGAGFRYMDCPTEDDPQPEYGMPIQVGETLIYDASMASLRVIAMAPGCKINALFYGEPRNAD